MNGRSASVLLLVLFSMVAPVRAQVLTEAQLIERWKAARESVDPHTMRQSAEHGGPRLLRTLLAIVEDPDRPQPVRVDAIDALIDYARPGYFTGSSVTTYRGPEGPLALRSCDLGSSSHPEYFASSSIEPALRDTLRVRIAALVEAESVDSVVAEEARCFLRIARRHLEVPAAIAAWASDSVDVYPIQTLRDRRVVVFLDSLALDPARPVAVRWSALQALATLAHPTLYVMSNRSLDGSTIRGARSWCSPWGWHHHHAVQYEGEQPLGVIGRYRVIALLTRQARTNPDVHLRGATNRLLMCVREAFGREPTPSM